jgi:hypothetical protein
MGGNSLRGVKGDRINALLAAAGFNFHHLLRWFRWLLCVLFAWFTTGLNIEKTACSFDQAGSSRRTK